MAQPSRRNKDEERDERLTVFFKNKREEKVDRETFFKMARAKCPELAQAFAECSRGRGLSLLFMCRDHSKAYNDCVKQYSGEEALARYRAQQSEIRRKKEELQQLEQDIDNWFASKKQ
eukprot:TRINITY_DN7084_c0_g1_i1.p1 TRINITY_DN7084_c0_g1~~TRINITY_DN7084_c0_g1_i1.p1  ORF type:complete len:137 (-),score=28.73 TRINITY_DN7084_c0_g1_i1:174-527(-)